MPSFPIITEQFPALLEVNIVAILSTFALLCILVRVLWLAILRLFTQTVTQTREYVFFHTQLGHYAACLLVANMSSSAAGVMGVPYLIRRSVTEDSLCTAQALFMQFGNIATAYFTVNIAVHTFTSLVLRRRQSAIVYSTVISFGWIASALLAALPLLLPHPRGPIYGQYLLTCGFRSEYPTHQFVLHLLPIFIAALGSGLLYPLVFLVLRGTLVIKGGVKLTLNPEDRWNGKRRENYHRFVAGIARSMLWYPVAYIALLVPYSVTKILLLAGFPVRFEGLIFAYVCWFVLGMVNVLLLYNTFRKLYPAFETKLHSKPDVESFGTAEQFRRLTAGHTPKDSASGFGELQGKVRQYDVEDSRLDPNEISALVHPAATAAVPSFYGYPTTLQRTARSAGAAVDGSDTNGLSRMESNESTYSRPSCDRDSTDIPASLPTPPLRTQSPRTNRGPALQVRNMTERTSSLIATDSPTSTRHLLAPSPHLITLGERVPLYQTSTQTRVHQRTPKSQSTSTTASFSSLNDISQWVAQQRPDGTMLNTSTGLRPLQLSTMGPSFPSTVTTNARPRVNSPTLYHNRSQSNSPASMRRYPLPSRLYQNAPASESGGPPARRYHQRGLLPGSGSY